MTLRQNLPPPVVRAVDALAVSLQNLLGDNMVSLLAHGSVVRGEYQPGRSDIDMLLILQSVSPKTLECVAPAARSARDSARVELMILKQDEIGLSHDVFPLFYDELMACHELVAGISPFGEVRLSSVHLRLRVEQELRDANIRLRRIAIDAVGNPARLASSIHRVLKRVRYPLIVLMRMEGIGVKGPLLPQVIEAAAERWQLRAEPLQNLTEDPEASFAAVFHLLQQATNDADKLLLAPSVEG